LRPNRVRELWREGEPIVTGWCTTSDPFVTEAMLRAGFDALILDMQHGMGIGPERATTWLQIVAQCDATPFVRLPWNEPSYAQWVLDAGSMGVIVPMVNNRSEAAKAVGACRYPPLGYRSWGPGRARMIDPEYFACANHEIICLVMIETVAAVENIDDIAQIPGLDGFWVGPSDLAVSMGLGAGGWEDNLTHYGAVQTVIDAAKKHGLQAGIMPRSPEDAVRRWRQGFNLNPVCRDIRQVIEGSRQSIAEFRQGVGGA